MYKKRKKFKGVGYGKKYEQAILTSLEGFGLDFKFEGVTIDYFYRAKYKPDITLGSKILIEIKTYLPYDEQRKLRAVKDSNPGIDLRILFQNSEKPIPGGRMTHGEWADKYGFKWANESIPDDWLKEALNETYERSTKVRYTKRKNKTK